MNKFVFERYEYKYLITYEQYIKIKDLILKKLTIDEHGITTIQSLYYDTNTNLLIRLSLDKPDYKEKIRVRSYGLNQNNDDVFLELKKKSEGLVFKRRIVIKEDEVEAFFSGKKELSSNQVSKEITYFKKFYGNLKPSVLLLYDREAFYDRDSDLRITFDNNIRYRDYDLNLHTNLEGNKLLDNDYILMEIKSAITIPFYLVRFLSENKIYKTAFSKYGTAYKKIYFKGEKVYG